MWRSTALGLLERISTFTVCVSGLYLLNVFIGLQGNKLRKHLRNHWFQNVHFPDEQQEIIMNTQLRTLHKKVLDKWQVVRQRQEETLKREEVEDLTPLRVVMSCWALTKICVSCWLQCPVHSNSWHDSLDEARVWEISDSPHFSLGCVGECVSCDMTGEHTCLALKGFTEERF